MSRLGKKPIALPKGVEVKVEKNVALVKGAKGQLETPIPNGISLKIEQDQVVMEVETAKLTHRSMHGLHYVLLKNAITGVTDGFEKKLSLIGVGYRAAVKGTSLDLQLGFSHPSLLDIPEGLSVKVEKNTMITISGTDKQKVGQFAANVRALRPPEPYKGKGVRYVDEYVRKKAGKTAKGK